MSKAEHDAAAAVTRGAQRHPDRPWYRSVEGVLVRRQMHGLRCLDLCAGNAEFSEILRDRFGMTVTSADYAPAHLEHAKALGFETLRVDFDAPAEAIERLASQYAGQFDLVVSLATIEHVFDSDNFLRFAHAVLKPGGHLLVNTPNISFIGYRLYSLCSGNRPFGEGHHIRFWDYRFLRTNLFLNGFQVGDDGRRFFTLPVDPATRALRGRRRLGAAAATLFHACRLLQHIPGGKGWFADELTVLAKKEDVPTIGFGLTGVLTRWHGIQRRPEAPQVVARLKDARARGWLSEHLMLADFVDRLES